jgi:hypothetical protein
MVCMLQPRVSCPVAQRVAMNSNLNCTLFPCKTQRWSFLAETFDARGGACCAVLCSSTGRLAHQLILTCFTDGCFAGLQL